MQPLRIRLCDFHRRLPQSRDYFLRLLKGRYEVDSDSAPDFVIYSNYGRSHREHDCVRIFYSMENERPDFDECDFALTFDLNRDPRHFRLPYFLTQDYLPALLVGNGEPRSDEELLVQKADFCCFVHSNPFGASRNRLLSRLSRYRRVSSGGRYRNNLGRVVDDKLAFARSFKFAFAFENESYPGYTTEKISDALAAGAIPIYWGNPKIAEDFNPAAFLNRHDFDSDEALIRRIIEIDQNDELFLEYLRQPAFVGNQLPARFGEALVSEFLDRIFGLAIEPVARRHTPWSQRSRQIAPRALARRARRFAKHSVKGIRLATGI